MLKLMKYEFRKQAWSKAIILFLAAVLEIVFIIGILTDKENLQGTGFGFLTLLAVGAVFFVGLECVDTFSKDLKTKCSYMLFLTPHTSYSIIGAKIIVAGIQVIATGFAFFGLFVMNFFVLVGKYGEWEELLTMIKEIANQILNIKIDMKYIVIVLLAILISWLSFIIMAFFSITLSTTFLANKKFKGFVSIIIFVVISWAMGYINNLLFGNQIFTETKMWYILIYTFVFTGITYIGTAWMLEKKVSV